jgi:hypothetical protein
MASDKTLIFISYSRDDKEKMEIIKACLEGHPQLQPWVDVDDIMYTVAWTMQVESAIYEADLVIALLSPAASESEWVRNEIAYAKMCEKGIVPVVIAGEEIRLAMVLALASLTYLDLRQVVNLSLCDVLLEYVLKAINHKPKNPKLA